MTGIEIAAQRDAEDDYHHDPRPLDELLEWCALARAGSAWPAAAALGELGREALCRAWGVYLARWDADSAAWFATYHAAWCKALERLLEQERTGPR